jgi:hypothetical protein
MAYRPEHQQPAAYRAVESMEILGLALLWVAGEVACRCPAPFALGYLRRQLVRPYRALPEREEGQLQDEALRQAVQRSGQSAVREAAGLHPALLGLRCGQRLSPATLMIQERQGLNEGYVPILLSLLESACRQAWGEWWWRA